MPRADWSPFLIDHGFTWEQPSRGPRGVYTAVACGWCGLPLPVAQLDRTGSVWHTGCSEAALAVVAAGSARWRIGRWADRLPSVAGAVPRFAAERLATGLSQGAPTPRGRAAADKGFPFAGDVLGPRGCYVSEQGQVVSVGEWRTDWRPLRPAGLGADPW